jgi:hypothetical protein
VAAFFNFFSCEENEFDVSSEKSISPLVQWIRCTTMAAADRETLHKILHTLKQNNPNVATRPELVFPLGVTLADSTVKQFASKNELKTIKES